jgi:hypothetical protein
MFGAMSYRIRQKNMPGWVNDRINRKVEQRRGFRQLAIGKSQVRETAYNDNKTAKCEPRRQQYQMNIAITIQS